MKLTVLVDNNTYIDRYLLGEPALSFFIEADGKKILFDAGYSDVFIKNAQKLSVNLLDLDYVVISHGHLDHTWGLVPLIRLFTESKLEGIEVKKPRLISHPRTFLTKRSGHIAAIGSLLDEATLSEHFHLKLGRSSMFLTEHLVYLGEIDRSMGFESKKPLGKTMIDGKENDDFLTDDSALAYKLPSGLVIITGCSHSGICNIVEQAKKISKEERIVEIIGGFHLLNPTSEQLEGTLSYMKGLCPGSVHACHCTDFNSKRSLSDIVNLNEVGSGLVLEY